MTYRTQWLPGDEMSDDEKQLRYAHQNLNTAMAFGFPQKIAKAQDEVDRLTTLAKEKHDKPKAERKKSTEPSESEILKAVMQALRLHPKVSRVWRQNSVTAKFSGRDGKTRFVRANTAKGMSDVMGILKDGRTLAVEVKSRIGKVEQHQWDFLRSINDAGGVAFVARNVSDVMTNLEDK